MATSHASDLGQLAVLLQEAANALRKDALGATELAPVLAATQQVVLAVGQALDAQVEVLASGPALLEEAHRRAATARWSVLGIETLVGDAAELVKKAARRRPEGAA